MKKTLKKQTRNQKKSRKHRKNSYKSFNLILGGTRAAPIKLKSWITAHADRLIPAELAKNPFGIQHLQTLGVDMMSLLERICENSGHDAYDIIFENMETISTNERMVKALCKNQNPEVIKLLKPRIKELLEAEKHIPPLRAKVLALTFESSDASKQFPIINKELTHNKGLKRRKPELDARRDELQRQIDEIQESRKKIDDEKTRLQNQIQQLEQAIKDKFGNKALVVSWSALAENPNPEAVKLLSKRTSDWSSIATELPKNPNPDGFQLYLDHVWIIVDSRGKRAGDLPSIAKNPCDAAVEFLIKQTGAKISDYINHLSSNPNPLAINLLRTYPTRIDWHELCKNPSPDAMDMLKDHFKDQLQRKTLIDGKFWVNLSKNPSKEALELIKDNLDFIIEHNFSAMGNGGGEYVWAGLSKNPLIFQHDYRTMRSVNKATGMAETAAAVRYHPAKQGLPSAEGGWDIDEEEEEEDREPQDPDVEVYTPREERKAKEEANFAKMLSKRTAAGKVDSGAGGGASEQPAQEGAEQEEEDS